jgi:hypothetical protein
MSYPQLSRATARFINPKINDHQTLRRFQEYSDYTADCGPSSRRPLPQTSSISRRGQLLDLAETTCRSTGRKFRITVIKEPREARDL